MFRRLAATLALALVVAPAGAQTSDPMNPDRPGVSNGASTVGAGRLQVEIGGNVFWDEGDKAFDTLPVAVRYGVGKAFELRLESDTVSIHGPDRGVADLFAGVKWTFHAGNPMLGLMARARFPTGSRAFRGDAVTPDFTLLANVPLGQTWSVEANVALAVQPVAGEDDRIAQWIYAATVGAAVTSKLQAFAELSSIGADTRNGPRQALADAGIAYALKDDLVLDLDVIAGLSSSAPDWGLTGGVSIRF
jgi:outer membrane putative beta-barrel porin/alpha-amylase